MGRPLGGRVGQRDLQLLLWSNSEGRSLIFPPHHVLHVSELTPSLHPSVTLRSVFASLHHSPPHECVPRSLSRTLACLISCIQRLTNILSTARHPLPYSLAGHTLLISRLSLSTFFGVKSFLTGTGHLLCLTPHHRRGPPWMLKPSWTARLAGASHL